MKRTRALLVLSLLMLPACRPGTAEWRAFQGTRTFVNQSDTQQVIELHPNAVTRLAGTLGMSWLLKRGERGQYTFGGQRGEYTYVAEAAVMFKPDEPALKEWSSTIQQDGSLRDASGSVWLSRP